MTKKAKRAEREELPVDMSAVVLKVGQMGYIQPHPMAPDMVYVPLIDVGEEVHRTIASGLAKDYKEEEIEDRMVVVLANVRRVNVYGTSSDGLVLCARGKDRVEPLVPPPGAVPGDLVTVPGWSPPSSLPKITHRQFQHMAADLWVDQDRRAVYKGVPLEVEGKGLVTTEILVDCPIDCPVKY